MKSGTTDSYYQTLDRAYRHIQEPNMRIHDEHDPIGETTDDPGNAPAWINAALLLAATLGALITTAILWIF